MNRSPSRLLGMVAFIVFVDMLGVGVIIPVMPSLIGELGGVPVDRAAEIGGLLMFIYALMQFLFAPVIGGLSDRFGRRPVLLVTLAVLGIDYSVMAVAPTLAWLAVGRALSGIMGATWAASNSCIADRIPAEERGGAFGLMGGAGAAGFVLGPALGGVAGEFGTRLPFMIAAGLALAGAAVGYFLLGETLAPERRRRFEMRRANPLGSLISLSRYPFVISCLLVLFFMQLGAQAQLSIWAYWGELRFGWTPLDSGLTVALYGIMIGIVQALLTGTAIRRFGASRTARYSLLFGLPSYLLLASASHTWTVIPAVLIGALTGMTFPSMQSRMTAHVEEDAQGELQGAIASTISLTSIIGPVIMTRIFGHFADGEGLYLPGAPYLLSMVLTTVAIAILWRTFAREREPASA